MTWRFEEGGGPAVAGELRLDNGADLRRALDLPPDAPDAELLRRGVARWGEALPDRLRGDFAFALDDGAGGVFAARDPLGVKPLAWRVLGGRIHCASGAPELRPAGPAPSIDEIAVADYLAGIDEDRVRTFWRGIARLPPGHWLRWHGGTLRIGVYWRPDPATEARLSPEEGAEGFRERLEQAVRRRVGGPARVGALLSGGLDSSSIVCIARRQGAPGLPTFTAAFTTPVSDERAYARAVAGASAHFVDGERLDPLGDLDACLAEQDEPFCAPNLYLHRALYGAARDAGARALLDGIDGDTTVGHGLPRLQELARAGRLGTLAREVRLLASRHGKSAWRILKTHVLAPLEIAPRRRLRRWRGVDRWSEGGDAALALVDPAFARRTGLAERRRALLRARWEGARDVRSLQAAALARGLMARTLETAHRAAAAAGLEPRYPFFDRDLVEFCLALPSDQKLKDGWTRVVLRRAMRGVLPEAIRRRPGKADLSPRFVFGLGEGRLEAAVEAAAAALDGIAHAPALRASLKAYRARPTDTEALRLWRAVTLGRWMERVGKESAG